MRKHDNAQDIGWEQFASNAVDYLDSYYGVSVRGTEAPESLYYNAGRIHAAYLDIITRGGSHQPYTDIDDYTERWSPPPSTDTSLATGAHISLYIPRHPEKPQRTGTLYEATGSGLVIEESAVVIGAMLLAVEQFEKGAFYMLFGGQNGVTTVQKLDNPDVSSRQDDFLCTNGPLPPYMPSLTELRALPSLMEQAATLYLR